MLRQIFTAPVQVQTKLSGSSSGAHPKTTVEFFEVLRNRLFSDYVDEDAPLSYGGMSVSAANKYGTAGTYIMSKAIEDISNVISVITNIESFKTKIYERVASGK